MEALKYWAQTQGTALLSNVLKTVIIAVIGILIIRIVMRIINKALEKSKFEKAAFTLIKTLAKTVMGILLALILASSLGIDVTGVVALASVVSLAISLSLQNMLANVIGGFTILYTHPFHSGDYVEIAGQAGTVKEVGMAYTKLITPDNKMVSIPNNAVVAAEIVNYSTTGTRRVDIAINASYDAPAETVIKVLVEAADHELILKTPAEPFAALTAYGDSSISYVLRYWVKSEDYWTVTYYVNRNVKTVFDANGIEMTYPHLNVHLDK